MDDAIPLLAIAAFAADHMRPAIAELAFFVRLFQAIAMRSINRYSAPVTVSPVAGRENPNIQTAHKRPKTIAGAIFSPAMTLYGGCAWARFGVAGFRLGRFLTPRTVRHHLPRENGGDGSTPNGAVPMKHPHAINPSKSCAAAHRAMALAALRADSSLSVRLKRFNAQMAIAHALEAQAMEFRRKTDATDTAIELRRSSTKRED